MMTRRKCYSYMSMRVDKYIYVNTKFPYMKHSHVQYVRVELCMCTICMCVIVITI